MPPLPQRILVAGTSGAGKTTLAGRVSAVLGLPYTELDSLFHGPGWTPRPEFEEDVRAVAAQEAWVSEWQYAVVRPLLLERAEVLVWLDLPVPVVLWQVLCRTLYRRWRRVELWNGNIEPPLWTVLTADDHILRWAWKTRYKNRGLDEYLAAQAPHVRVVRLRSRREVDRWVTELAEQADLSSR
ncbi:AAA family ATPase [Isoptericola sp. NEAU-Y5]|uniref:AAA family ATPase n=1 Tax=Isoptericola luteus TaxID=2879484 RepID=A0ABS7ZGB9_9MICO|nr:AAA family ATPase [Isoptericola sp. NEAU-Y5]MCA5894074.1 AAA family ATPase [Isoptericola sp. NEAU-Y5]